MYLAVKESRIITRFLTLVMRKADWFWYEVNLAMKVVNIGRVQGLIFHTTCSGSTLEKENEMLIKYDRIF